MAQINKSSEYFNTVLWTGDSDTNHAITDVGFQPDLIWFKIRSGQADDNTVVDSVRGNNKRLKTNLTASEAPDVDEIKSFDTNGFTLGTDNGSSNYTGFTYVAWNWLADNTSGSSNTDGSITSTVSANTTSGFSIATYTGNNTNAQTIGHGLGVAPKVYIIKRRDSTSAWGMYHGSLGANKYLQLESTNSEATDTGIWNNTAPTSSVLSIGNAGYFNNASGGTYVCYAFAEKKGFSKFGSYTGNGSTDGTFIYTGFKPAFFLLKETSGADNWTLMDNKRLGYNPRNEHLFPNLSNAEYATDRIDMVSNGIKINNDDPSINQSGATYIYMAFAESPLVGTNNIPATAR